jgi:hypothetical protein
MRWLALVLCAGAILVMVSAAGGPAMAKVPPPFTVTVSASPAAYSGPCPVTIKITGQIVGDPFTKLNYQFARVIGGAPSLTPWTAAVIPAVGKLTVADSITVLPTQAGVETDVLRVLPGPAEATVKVSVVCLKVAPTPKPTSKPNITFVNPGVSITPVPTASPKVNPGANASIFAPALHKLPPPINLQNTTSKDVCQQHGGSAGSFACYIALPAGNLVLVWDYPYPDKIDGYNVYAADSAPSGPYSLHLMGPVKPIATQSDPTLHLEVLQPLKAPACFAITAFHGSDESDRSVRYCVSQAGVAKNISLNPDSVGAMVADWFYDTHTEVWKQSNQQPSVRDLLNITVGYSHDVGTWSDSEHKNVSMWINSLYRGYVHFNTFALSGHQIAQAQLHLIADAQGTTCLAKYGPSDHVWTPGSNLGRTADFGNGPYQGPDLHLDVTSIVQNWATSPGTNLGLTLDSTQPEVIYNMIILASTCVSHFPTATLDVTYY